MECLFKNTDNFNLWALDNGSTDGTQEFLRYYCHNERYKYNMQITGNSLSGDILFSRSETNLGVIGGRNFLYNDWKSQYDSDVSEYVCILDNDQFVQPGWLEDHMKFLGRKHDIVGVEAWRMNKDFLPFARVKNQSQKFQYVGCGGMLMHRRVLDKIGLFDERFNPAYFEDPDFCFAAYDAGFKIAWNQNAKIVHLAHQTLGNMDWKTQFRKSHQKFKDKWKGRELPEIHNIGEINE